MRGRICIHASKGITRKEYDDASEFMESIGISCPPAVSLMRGGIIGTVTVNDVVKDSDSPWFFGPRGLVLSDPEPCNFIPATGKLGYFKWRLDNTLAAPKTPRWMLPALHAGAARRETETLPLLELANQEADHG